MDWARIPAAARASLLISAALLVHCSLGRSGLNEIQTDGTGGAGGLIGNGGGGSGQNPAANSSTGAGGGTGGTGGNVGTGGNGGSGGAQPFCGDGLIASPGEACDDKNTTGDDGCTQCEIDDGYECTGAPSVCSLIEAHTVSLTSLNVDIKDRAGLYNGDLSTMDCIDVVFPDLGYDNIQDVEFTVGVDHEFLGDLIIKLVSPNQPPTIVTVVNRAGMDEAADAYQEVPNGDSSDLVATDPITFKDNATTEAENMGDGDNLGNSAAACRDNGVCVYDPSPGMGPGLSLADFSGESPVGTWQACFADGDDVDEGTVDNITLSILAW